MRILVINAGSATLKYAQFKVETDRLERLASATVEWEGGHAATVRRAQVSASMSQSPHPNRHPTTAPPADADAAPFERANPCKRLGSGRAPCNGPLRKPFKPGCDTNSPSLLRNPRDCKHFV